MISVKNDYVRKRIVLWVGLLYFRQTTFDFHPLECGALRENDLVVTFNHV